MDNIVCKCMAVSEEEIIYTRPKPKVVLIPGIEG